MHGPSNKSRLQQGGASQALRSQKRLDCGRHAQRSSVAVLRRAWGSLLRILTDRGSEFCGNRETPEYALYLDLESIDHSRTQIKSPPTNGICERFHQTIKNEFYASAFRRKLYVSLEQLQADVDIWMESYNAERTHSGKYCYGKTPLQTFIESAPLAYEKQLNRIMPTVPPVSLQA